MSFRFLILAPAIPFLISACTPIGMATGAAATTGMAVAQEGGISRVVSDKVIQAKINDAWLNYDVKTFAKLDTTVNFGRVLITGVVQDPEDRVEAVRLAWQVEGVTQVINEIRVAESEGVQGFLRDNWISTRLRTAITFNRDIQSINYTIDTVQGVVYLMGVAQNQRELNRVIETARTIPHVKQVVSYVKMAGQKPQEAAVQSSGQAPAQPPSSYSGGGQPVDSGFRNDMSAMPPGGDVTGPPGSPAPVEAVPLQ